MEGIITESPVLITFNYDKVLEKVREEVNSLDPLKSNKTNLDALYIVIYVLHNYYENNIKAKGRANENLTYVEAIVETSLLIFF